MMSRRKQARPRLCKRDEEDDTNASSNEAKSSELSNAERNKPDQEPEFTEPTDNTKGDFEETGPESKLRKFETEDPSDLRCDTCGALFQSLTQFMDHRNFECGPGVDSDNQWTIENLAVNMGQPGTPSSVESGDTEESPLVFDSPLSPGVENLSPEDIPGAIGVSQTNPYGCQFCNRAFSRLSYLKIHEQIHGDQLPFKCSLCSRRFRHKRSRDRHIKLHTGDKKFKCTHCQAAFVRSDHLKSHMKTHENPKAYQCSICNRGFPSVDLMTSHMSIHGPDSAVQEFKCPYCSKIYTTLSEFRSHLADHEKIQNPGLLCSLCGNVFSNQEELDIHVEKVHFDDQRNKCPLCSEVFLNVLDLYTHMATHENSSDVAGHSNRQMNTSYVQSVQSDLLVCPYCFCSDFDTLEILEIHMQSMHSVKPAEVYTCNYCNAPYKNLYSLHEHMRAVHQNQPCLDIKYPCSLCSRQFGSIETLIQHKRALHPNEHRRSSSEFNKNKHDQRTYDSAKNKKISQHANLKIPTPRKNIYSPVSYGGHSHGKEEITCEHCNAKFYDFPHFQTHMKHHLEEKIPMKLHEALSSPGFTCKHCSLRFSSEDQLEKHMTSHYLSTATEYGCNTCVKLFSKPDELQKHLMDIHAHHLYRCSLCKEIFDSKVNIQVHFAIKHSNECKLYKCTKCESVFRSEMEWNVHVRVNHLHVAKPYRCLFCQDGFSSEMDLQCHLTTHNRPLKCPMCPETFHVEYLLDKHMQKVHSSDGHHETQSPKQLTRSPGCHNNEMISPKQSCVSPVKIKMEKEMMNSGYGGDPRPDNSPRFSPGSSPGIWKSTDLMYTCNICDMKFSQQSLLMNHKSRDHGLTSRKLPHNDQDVKPSLIQEQLQRDRPLKPPTSITEQPTMSTSVDMPLSVPSMSLPVVMTTDRLTIACMYCSQTFKNRHDLDKHMKIHLNNGDEKCNICDKVFPTPSVLAEHKLTHCKIKEGNVCVLCKISLKTEEQFYIHTQEHGFQSSYIQCLVCRQTLVSMVELQMHGKHHFQSTPSSFTCCVCLQAFDSKDDLISRVNTSGRNYFVCKGCYHGDKNSHQCDKCGVSFLSAMQLEAHVVTHHGNKSEHTCPHCKSTFQSSLLLRAHIMAHHSDKMEFPCPQCNAIFQTQIQLEAHSLSHRKSYTCIKCQESFDTEQDIQLHVATHVMKEGNIHECKLCMLNFESPAKLQCHLIEHTYKNSEYRCSVCCNMFHNAVDIQKHAVEHGLEARRYACNQCNQKFFFSAELENHRYCHGNMKKSLSDHITVASSNKQDSLLTSLVNGSVQFDIKKEIKENESFSDGKTEQDEMASVPSHINGSASHITCPECPKTFNTITELSDHLIEHIKKEKNSIQSDGSKLKVYTCTECKKKLPCISDFHSHLQSHHTGGKPSCSVCQKTFKHSQNLSIHMKLHSGGKHFECPVCHKKFSRKENKKAHMKIHKEFKADMNFELQDEGSSENGIAVNGDKNDKIIKTDTEISGHEEIDHVVIGD